MEIIEHLKSKENVLLIVSSDDLKQFADYLIKQACEKLLEENAKLNEEVYYTKDQVVKILKINPSSLWNWSNKGFLMPVKVGGLNRYKKSDIDKILNSNHGNKRNT